MSKEKIIEQLIELVDEIQDPIVCEAIDPEEVNIKYAG